MQDPADFYDRARKGSLQNQNNNTLDLLLDVPQQRKQKEQAELLKREIDERMVRLKLQAQRNQICLNCSLVTCLGCCCAFLYYCNQTIALSKKYYH